MLNEVVEVVKFSAMSLVDKLLMVNSPQKIEQEKKVKKHKHVTFADAPTIVTY